MWDPGFSLRARLATGELMVGDWSCAAAVAGVGPEERANHYEVWLQRAGSRGVRVGHARGVGDAASAILVNASDPVRPVYPADGRQISTAILLDHGLVRALLAEVDPGAAEAEEPRFPSLVAPVSAEAALLHHALVGHPDATPLEAQERALALLRHLVARAHHAAGGRPVPRTHARGTGRELAEAVRHLLAARYAERLTLDDVGRAVGTSPFHLSRVFSREVGVPIHRYLLRLRLRVALELMSQRPRDLSWVALEAGFASHSHFTAAFTGEYGVPPSRVARGAGGG